MYDLMVIDDGPAGLAASDYAAHEQLKTLLVAKDISGQVNLTLGIEDYLGYQFIEGPELIDKFQTQMDQFPIEQRIGEKAAKVEQINGGYQVVTEGGERYQARAAILASGKRPRTIGVPSETELLAVASVTAPSATVPFSQNSAWLSSAVGTRRSRRYSAC